MGGVSEKTWRWGVTMRRPSRVTRTASACRPTLAVLLAGMLAVTAGTMRGLDSEWNSEEISNSKNSLRVVLVLGTGCENLNEHDYELERNCSQYYSTYGKHLPWEHPEPPCNALPATRPDRLTAEYALGWHLNCDYRMAYTAILRRAAPYLRAQGWNNFVVVEYLSKEERQQVPLADFVIAPQTEFQDDLQTRYADKKFIVVHTDDQATIHPDLDLNSDQIVGVFMHTSFVDLEENNRMAPHFMRHCAWMIPPARLETEADGHWRRKPPISKENLDKKVYTIIPQILRWVYPLDCGGNPNFILMSENAFGQDPEFSKPLTERSIDIAFLGAVGEELQIQHEPGEHVDPEDPNAVWEESIRSMTGVLNHRQKAIEALEALAEKHNLTIVTDHSKWKYPRFLDLLKDTKIFVSPFGLGEFSGKDYEAILAGSVLVKPLASKLRSFPNIYEPRFMLETKSDFSNLEEMVMPILSKADNLRTKGQWMVERSQEHLRKYANMDRFVTTLDGVLQKLLIRENSIFGSEL